MLRTEKLIIKFISNKNDLSKNVEICGLRTSRMVVHNLEQNLNKLYIYIT